MPVSVVAVTVASSATNSITVAEPAGVQVGDVLIAVHRAQNTRDTYPGPAGFTRVTPYIPGSADGRTIGIWSRAVTTSASRPASYTIDLGGGVTRQQMAMMLVRGLDTADLVSDVVESYTGEVSGPRLAVESLTAATETFQLFMAAGEVTDGNPHRPSANPVGFTEAASLPEGAGTTGSRTALWVGYRMADAGPTGVVESAWVWQTGGGAQSVLFRPSGAQPQLPSPTLSVTKTDPSAPAATDGQAVGSWTGGPGTFESCILPGEVTTGASSTRSSTATSRTFTGLAAGTYTVAVRRTV